MPYSLCNFFPLLTFRIFERASTGFPSDRKMPEILLTGCDYSRPQQFEALEKEILKPLNKYMYDPMTTKMSTVEKTGYVAVDYYYYSVP